MISQFHIQQDGTQTGRNGTFRIVVRCVAPGTELPYEWTATASGCGSSGRAASKRVAWTEATTYIDATRAQWDARARQRR